MVLQGAFCSVFNVNSLFICCRLQYFARGVQAYIKQLRLALQGKTGDALKTEDVRNYYLSQVHNVTCNLI